jgi:hypothetical protein
MNMCSFTPEPSSLEVAGLKLRKQARQAGITSLRTLIPPTLSDTQTCHQLNPHMQFIAGHLSSPPLGGGWFKLRIQYTEAHNTTVDSFRYNKWATYTHWHDTQVTSVLPSLLSPPPLRWLFQGTGCKHWSHIQFINYSLPLVGRQFRNCLS